MVNILIGFFVIAVLVTLGIFWVKFCNRYLILKAANWFNIKVNPNNVWESTNRYDDEFGFQMAVVLLPIWGTIGLFILICIAWFVGWVVS